MYKTESLELISESLLFQAVGHLDDTTGVVQRHFKFFYV